MMESLPRNLSILEQANLYQKKLSIVTETPATFEELQNIRRKLLGQKFARYSDKKGLAGQVFDTSAVLSTSVQKNVALVNQLIATENVECSIIIYTDQKGVTETFLYVKEVKSPVRETLLYAEELQPPVYKNQAGPESHQKRLANFREYSRFEQQARRLGWSRLDGFNTEESVKTYESSLQMAETIDTNAYDYMIVQEPHFKHYLIYTKPKISSSDLEDAK